MEHKALIDVKDGQPEKAMQIFQQMQWEEISPDKLTFLEVINACAGHLGVLEDCRLIHEQLIQTGCNSDLFVRST
jgi:pentatricopeptide repeat protein